MNGCASALDRPIADRVALRWNSLAGLAVAVGVPAPANAARCPSWRVKQADPPRGVREEALRMPLQPSGPRCRVPAVEGDAASELSAEAELCARAHAGDRDALGAILRQHGPRLFRCVLLPRLGNRALAEEALSATYVKVVERFAQFTWQSVGVYPWLRVVALRVALDLVRSRKRERLFDPADLERELDATEREDRSTDLLERHDLELCRRRVELALGSINERYAQVIRLRVLEERSREEAARELGVSVATLDVVLHRALAALKKALASGREAAA